MPKLKWTKEAIRAEAVKYGSKGAFQRGNSGAHGAARRIGLLDELFENLRNQWDEQSIRAEAAKYDSKNAFCHGNKGAYAAALRLGLIDELFDNKHRSWTEESLRAEAAKYDSKIAFNRGSLNAYSYIIRRFPGLIDELFGKNFRWTKETIRAEAVKYDSKKAFVRGCGSAYQSALKVFPGLLDELFENQPRYTDADAFYIWRVDGHWFNGLPVYKFGLTSARTGTSRIHQCASKNGVRATEIQLFKSETAKDWERIFHDAFTVVPDLGFTDGKTEFRACKESDVRAFVDFIRADVMPMAA